MSDLEIEYQYDPDPEAAERLKEAWDLIIKLMIEDLEQEQEDRNRTALEGE